MGMIRPEVRLAYQRRLHDSRPKKTKAVPEESENSGTKKQQKEEPRTD